MTERRPNGNPSPERQSGDRVPETEEEQEGLVEETIDESFPASDPPSYWGRETTDDPPQERTDG